MKLLNKYMKIIKIEYPIKHFKPCFGEEAIQHFLFIKRKKRNGLIFEPVSTIPFALWAGK
jgi:hypothetical protein